MKKSDKETNTISVIVCTHNGSKTIDDTLKSLLKNKGIEIVVVDDCSTDATADLVKKYKNIKLITNQTKLGLAQSRNIGIAYSTGEIICFTDDDCIVPDDWTKKIAAVFTRNLQVMGISGKVVGYRKNSLLQKYYYYSEPLKSLSGKLSVSTSIYYRLCMYIQAQWWEKKLESFEKISSVVGANMAFRRSILTEFNGFNKTILFGGEEEEFCYRIIKSKNQYDLRYVPDIYVYHQFDSSIKRFITRNYNYGKGNSRLKKMYPERSLTLFPSPVIYIMCAILGKHIMQNELFVLCIVIFPLVLYPSWVMKAFREKIFFMILFPYFQLIQELAHNIGWMKKFLFE